MEKEVFVVGGASSLSGFNFSLLSNQNTIVTNKAILDVPNPKYFITIDYTFLSKINPKRFDNIKCDKFFIADLSYPFLKEQNGQIVDTRYNLIYNLENYNVVIKSKRKDGIGFNFSDFRNGMNSGYCAMQLAVILGFTKIYLLGIDLNISNKTHYHNGYNTNKQDFQEKLNIYYKYFAFGLQKLKESNKNIEVYSCSKISRLNNIIKYKDVGEVL